LIPLLLADHSSMIVRTLVPSVCAKYNAIRLHAELWHRALGPHLEEGSSVSVARWRDARSNGRAVQLYHYGSFDWLAWALSYSRDAVFVFHNVTPVHELWQWSPMVALRALAAELQLRLMPKDLPWVAVSEFNRKQLLKIGFKTVETVPLIFDGQTKGPKSDRPTLLFVGRIAPNKNVIALLRAFCSVWEGSAPKPRLVLVGARKRRCRYADAFERELASCPARADIVWHASSLRHSELQDLYRSAWLYLSMSRHEGFGAPVCEAVSFGAPALFLECGGTESVFGAAGRVRREDLDHFADRVLELLASEEARLGLLREQDAIVQLLCSSRVAQMLRSALRRLRTTRGPGEDPLSRACQPGPCESIEGDRRAAATFTQRH
jgi:glycosyltransferase involved in cell wall biosynthesis